MALLASTCCTLNIYLHFTSAIIHLRIIHVFEYLMGISAVLTCSDYRQQLWAYVRLLINPSTLVIKIK